MKLFFIASYAFLVDVCLLKLRIFLKCYLPFFRLDLNMFFATFCISNIFVNYFCIGDIYFWTPLTLIFAVLKWVKGKIFQ
jgi:hypothetical protein